MDSCFVVYVKGALRAALCGLMIGAISGLAPMSARAEMIGTDEALSASSVERARAELAATLERADVRAELEALGIDALEADARIASLSDAEVLEIQGRLEELPAGANFATAVGGVLIVTITVLVITDLIGVTDVFPFIRPLRGPGAT